MFGRQTIVAETRLMHAADSLRDRLDNSASLGQRRPAFLDPMFGQFFEGMEAGQFLGGQHGLALAGETALGKINDARRGSLAALELLKIAEFARQGGHAPKRM